MKISIFKITPDKKKALKTMEEIQREYAIVALQQHKSILKASSEIKISRATFYRILNRNLKLKSKNYFYKENIKGV